MFMPRQEPEEPFIFVPRQEGPPIVMDEIPRTYYPGRGWLSDQEAYPIRYVSGNPQSARNT